MKRNVLVITYWSYKDALVQTYTLPYVRVMKKYTGTIYLVTLEQETQKLNEAEKQSLREKLNAEGIVPIFLKYHPFGSKAAFNWFFKLLRLWWICITKNVGTIHTWCTPAGMIGYFLKRSTGKRLVLDSFEPHAEPMIETGQWKKDSRAFRTLFRYEKKQAQQADILIGLTESMKAYAREKYQTPNIPFYIKPALIDFTLIPNLTEEDRGRFRKEQGLENKIVCVCAGKTGGLYFEKEVFEFYKAAADRWGNRFHAIMLSPISEIKLRELAREAGFPDEQLTVRYVRQDEVYGWMHAADFAFNPCRPVPSRRHGTSIKNAEYRTMGLPIVLSHDISDDSDFIAQTNTGAILNEMTKSEYDRALQEIDLLIGEQAKSIQEKIKELVKKERDIVLADQIYRDIYSKP
jgi:hypothetical protein